MNFRKNKKSGNLELQVVDTNNEMIVNKDESFAFHAYGKDADGYDINKCYMLNLDHEDKSTNLWYYTYKPEDKKKPEFRPNHFATKNSLPLLKLDPK